MTETQDDGQEKVHIRCYKGWPRVPEPGFAALPRDGDALPQQEAAKNESPHVFQPQRDHPFEGMSNPTAQACMRCNVDVKYLGRSLCSDDLDMLMAEGEHKCLDACLQRLIVDMFRDMQDNMALVRNAVL